MANGHWVPLGTLADVSGVTTQRLRYVVKRASLSDVGWRGATLIVRKVRGTGGRSGLRYEVRSDSLPTDIQERLKPVLLADEHRLNHGTKAQADRDWWFNLLQPALRFEKYTRERGEAIRDIASQRFFRANGMQTSFSVRTIQRKLEVFEDGYNPAVLSRSKRSDAGKPRTILSRKWDSAVPFDEATKSRIAVALKEYVRALHKAGEPHQSILVLSGAKLCKLTIEAGFSPGKTALETICRVPANLVTAESVFRKVHRLKTDRKAYEDARPRIKRSRAGLHPMDVIVGDVHPVDILVRRADGSTATPRAIAWLDLATGRLFMDLVLLDKGNGIRNSHVIQSFINLVRAWGAPTALYLDNGGEYNWADFIDDALKLIDREGRRLDVQRVIPWPDRRSNVVRALPYNASAKAIEGVFATLEPFRRTQSHFEDSQVLGFVIPSSC